MKKNFINDLQKVLKDYGLITEMFYEDNGVDEVVVIKNQDKTQIVNVNKDSLKQMLKDIVLKGGLD